jgi:hypothetical protein
MAAERFPYPPGPVGDALSALDRRLAFVERIYAPFRATVLENPQLSTREVILLWFRDHYTLDTRHLSFELEGSGVVHHTIVMTASRMEKEGSLVRVRPGIYRKGDGIYGLRSVDSCR